MKSEESKVNFMMSSNAFLSMDAMDKYFAFLKQKLVQPLIEDTVLCQNTLYFHHRKNVREMIKQQSTKHFPTFRFSTEIGVLIDYIY